MRIETASREQLQSWSESLEHDYQALRELGLKLDLTRGKPCTEQVALANALDGILEGNFQDSDGVDVRNYGGAVGISEARELFSGVLGSDPACTLVGGNSSLTLMYQVMDAALNFGLAGKPWKDSGPVKFLCPVPGYDRHFSICEHLGIEMINVPMSESGPDMDCVEELVSSDPAIRGIWCVPRFSNPTGVVYSQQTVERIARLGKQAAKEFLIMWDNAYAVHSLDDDAPVLTDLLSLCETQGTQDNLVQFGSTSKITFAGAGVAFLATSPANYQALLKHLSYSAIGPDKVNQLRHVRFLQNQAGLQQHMARHAAIIRPRFDIVLQQLQQELGDTDLGQWTVPKGGYFISFDSRPGLAQTIVGLAADIGVKLTPAGATFPYGKDPEDRNIRLSPTFPSVDDVAASMRAFIICVKLASVRAQLDA